MRGILTSAIFVAMLSFQLSAGAQEPRYIVVWETRPMRGVEKSEAQILTNLVRGEATNALSGHGYSVITEETVAVIVKKQGKKMESCEDEAQCLAEVAGAYGAEYMVSSTIGRLGKTYIWQLNLYNTRDGTLLRSVVLKAKKIDEFVDKLERESSEFFGVIVSVEPERPRVERGKNAPERYADLLDEQRKRDARNKGLEEAWWTVKGIASNREFSDQKKVEALKRFLADYPENNPHYAEGDKWIQAINAGVDLEDFVTSEERRTKTESFGLRFQMSNYGAGGTFSMFTMRWRSFCYELINIGGGGNGKSGEEDWYFLLGTFAAYPLFLDQEGRHEFRIGAGLGFLYLAWNYDSREKGLGIFPRVSYLYTIGQSFKLEAGTELRVMLLGAGNKDELVLDAMEYEKPPVNYLFFLGFRI